jgi:hypothetical protein
VDSTKTSDPLINNIFTVAFPPTYWTSTVYANDPSYSWYVEFRYGETYIAHNWLTVFYNVRCVR